VLYSGDDSKNHKNNPNIILPYFGKDPKDDTGVNGIKLVCGDLRSQVQVHNGFWGKWSSHGYTGPNVREKKVCPGSYSYGCGLEVKYYGPGAGVDDLGVTGIRMKCC